MTLAPLWQIELQRLFQSPLSLACCIRKDFGEVHKISNLKIYYLISISYIFMENEIEDKQAE